MGDLALFQVCAVIDCFWCQVSLWQLQERDHAKEVISGVCFSLLHVQ